MNRSGRKLKKKDRKKKGESAEFKTESPHQKRVDDALQERGRQRPRHANLYSLKNKKKARGRK